MGPIWIDPNFYQWRYRPQTPGPWEQWKTVTTDHTTPSYVPRRAPVDEERIRKIVREEIAQLPIPFDVPDSPPSDVGGDG